MKNNLLFLMFALLLCGCSSDDNSGGENNNDDLVDNFLPLEQGNYWVYDVNTVDFSGRDSLYVSGTNTSEFHTYYTYTTPEIPTGFYSTMMTSGQSRTEEGKIMMSGNIDLSQILGIELGEAGIAFEDFVFFDTDASQGTILDSNSGEFTIPYDQMNFTVEYTLATTAGQTLADYVAGGNTYQDVKSVVVVVSAQINANIVVFGVPVSYPILARQNIISSSQYYAQDIGMVYTATDIQYDWSEIPDMGIEVPFPEDFATNINETLDDYWVE